MQDADTPRASSPWICSPLERVVRSLKATTLRGEERPADGDGDAEDDGATAAVGAASGSSTSWSIGVPRWMIVRALVALLVSALVGHAAAALTWTDATQTGSVWQGTCDFAAVCFDDGVIVVTGGWTGTVLLSATMRTTAITTADKTNLALVQHTGGTVFTPRRGHAITRLPGLSNDDAFLIVGGIDDAGTTNFNDALLSLDRGTSYVEQSSAVFEDAPMIGRSSLGLVATGPKAFVAFGGRKKHGPGFMYANDVRTSDDLGVTWSTLRANGGGGGGECPFEAELMWSERAMFAYAYMSKRKRILLAGGVDENNVRSQDVWGSDDGGVCWMQLTADSDGVDASGYYGASLTVVTVGGLEVLLLAGGETGSVYLDVVYRSIDGGVTWNSLGATGHFASKFALLFDPSEMRAIILGGEGQNLYHDDFWVAGVGNTAGTLLSVYAYTHLTTCQFSSNGNSQCCETYEAISITSLAVTILEGAFRLCTTVVAVSFEDATELKAIASYAFSQMTSLVHVDMSGATKLAGIAFSAFQSCTVLESVKLASTTTSIEYSAFSGCTLLASDTSVDFNNVDCVAVTNSVTGVFDFPCPTWKKGSTSGALDWPSRRGHAAVSFADGAVMTTGGQSASGTFYDDVHGIIAGDVAHKMTRMSQTTFTARSHHAIARVPDPGGDSVLVVGGWTASGASNEALLTEDRGTNFQQKTATVFTTVGRYSLGLVATGADTFVAFGGVSRTGSGSTLSFAYHNEVRRSVDGGPTWSTLHFMGPFQPGCDMWDERSEFGYAFMTQHGANGRILIAAGSNGTPKQDVWGSDDDGDCWQQLTADFSGSGISLQGSALVVVRMSGVEIPILAGGSLLGGGEIYSSSDAGVTWVTLTSTGTMWPVRAAFAFIFVPGGEIAVFGGELAENPHVYGNDFWTTSASTFLGVTASPTTAPTTTLPTTSPSGVCSQGRTIVGEFAIYCGKVNVHTDPNDPSDWIIDPDCSSGCLSKDVNYCKALYPSADEIIDVPVTNILKPFREGGCGTVAMSIGQDQFACCAAPTTAPTTVPSTSPTTAPSSTPTVWAPTSSMPTSAPTSAPTTAPSSSPSTTIHELSASPTSAPTPPTTAPSAAPTHALGALIGFTTEVNVSEYASPNVLLAVNEDAVATGDEIISIACTANDDVAIPNAAPITIDSAGVRGTRRAIKVIAKWDAKQLATRDATVECTVTSSVASKPPAPLAIPVKILGVAQPSVALFCANITAKSCASAASFSTSLATNGGDTIIVIGGTCEQCPQPPFEAGSTVVSVGNVDTITTVDADGMRLAFTTPLKSESFNFDEYLPLTIRTAAGTQGALGGLVELGPGALATSSGGLDCARRGLCFAGRPETSGVVYVEDCLGFLNPVEDLRWDKSVDEDVLQLFAYGRPPACRQCPLGCRCPGGDRCRTIEGYYNGGETLPPDAAPALCHADLRVAKRRCAPWSAAAGGTVCLAGTAGERCELCAALHFRTESGECKPCGSDAVAVRGVFIIAGVFCAISVVSFALVAIVQTVYGRAVWNGAIRSMRFAGWIVSIFATQAQIGRSASGNQPSILISWYRLLKLFEFNPDGARPTECTSSTSSIAIVAMSIGLACVVVYMLLAIPPLTAALIRVSELLISPGVTTLQGCKQAKEGRTPLAKRSSSPSGVTLRSNPMASSRPSIGGAGGIEMSEFSRSAAAGVNNTISASATGATDGGDSKKVTNPSKTPRWLATEGVGYLRKGIAGTAVLFHPIVVTYAFRSVHCIIVPGKNVAVLARKPSVACFEGAHAHVFMLAVVTIVVETIIFPIFVMSALGVSVGWFRYRRNEGVELTNTEEAAERGAAAAVVGEGEGRGAASAAMDAGAGAEREGGGGGGAGWRRRCGEHRAEYLEHRDSGDVQWDAPVDLQREDAINALTRFGAVEAGAGDEWTVHYSAEHQAEYYAHRDSGAVQWDTPLELRAPQAANDGGGEGEVVNNNPAGGDSSIVPGGSSAVGVSPGTVHGGLCCRCVCCVQCIAQSRVSFDASHDRISQRARRLAYSSFTNSDYKPEFFFLRVLFLVAMSTIAACNTFLDPMTLSSRGGLAIPNDVLIAVQTVRFVISAIAILAPPVTIVALLPNKDGSRWKMPLRAMAAAVSLGMLSLNAFSWSVGRHNSPSSTLLQMNAVLSYCVFGLSMALLLTMAICFVIFVVFRGAQREVKEEEEAEIAAGAVARELENLVFFGGGDDDAVAAAASAKGGGPLPAPWTRHETPEGKPYYYNRDTLETRWTQPLLKQVVLPHGWTELAEEVSGKHYYHHAASKTSVWHHPTPQDDVAAVAKAAVLAQTEQEAQAMLDAQAIAGLVMHVKATARALIDSSAALSSSFSSSSSASGEDEEDDDSSLSLTRKKSKSSTRKKSKFVRWKFTARDDTTLADALLGSGASRIGGDGVPAYLVEIFDAIFVDGDKSGSGTLSTLDFMFMLQRRAKGTALDGNAHAIFKLKQLLASQSRVHSKDGTARRDSSGLGKIGKTEFAHGLFAAMRNDPNGACGQWILLEMMDAVEKWEEHEHRDDGTGEVKSFYFHTKTRVTSWEKPPLLVEMARITAILQRARPLSATSKGI